MSYSNLAFQEYLFYADEVQENDTENDKQNFTTSTFERFSAYDEKQYQTDIETLSVKKTWDAICFYMLENCEAANDFLKTADFGQLYEMALAIEDKNQKKSKGQYFTPDDVAFVMAKWFSTLDAENVCDVGCGTGNLILKYFEIIGKEKAEKLISDARLYLYDSDETALKICKTSILLKYGVQHKNLIHDIHCDFLDSKIKLPENCKVISNPPYAAIGQIGSDWNITQVLNDTRELYSCFMEKIIKQSNAAVIITPYSFISGAKFYSLRTLLNECSGDIYSFDNVPGNIFCGRKHGIFNTNTSNSVRAAIIVLKNKKDVKGFRTSSFMRFKNIERKKIA